MNSGMVRLQPYPFERLAALRDGIIPNPKLRPIALSIGEPQHPTPRFILRSLKANESDYSTYPVTRGLVSLRAGIADWLGRRFGLPRTSVDPESNVLPVNGTREALFSFAQFLLNRDERPLVLMPNPFYQIYEGAALLAGADPAYVNCSAKTGFLPDWDSVPESTWRRCKLLYICTPGNPTGAVAPLAMLRRLLDLSDEHGFVIASDECYSEIYSDEHVPPGLLQACAEVGRNDYRNCIVFHSLSKRSNVPGLRSGFVAGDARLLADYLRYRTYHGCAMPLPVQLASVAAWNDEGHVVTNRRLYAEKFEAVLPLLEGTLAVARPDAGFYLWAGTPISDEEFTLRLYRDHNVSVLPGSYLSREAHGETPGSQRIRISLVAPLDQCVEAAERIRDLTRSL